MSPAKPGDAWSCHVKDELFRLHKVVCQQAMRCLSFMNVCAAGIGYSDDKMLQTRIFSYADTQRYRLGPNYLMLPVNAPKNVHHNNHHDGVMNFMHRDEEVSHSACGVVFTDMMAHMCKAYSAVIPVCYKGLARPACSIRPIWANKQCVACHFGL